ncbi:MAG: electron transfer flavoprotein subunit alpha/FixB family protein [Dermatophilaceae bacterium]
MSQVLVLAEVTPSGVRKATLELLTFARRLGEPAAVLCGTADPAAVATLAEYGAATVYTVPGSEFDSHLALPTAEALVAVAAQAAPYAILVTSGPDGKDAAARVAVRLDAGIVTDAVDLESDGGSVIATQSVVNGSYRARTRITSGTAVVTVRPNSVTPEPSPADGAVVEVAVTFSDAAKGTVVERRDPKTSTGRPDLTDATSVVTGGRGVGSQDGFALVEQLADALGAAVGATRAVTDLDWASHDLQIGQTGKTVSPSLYLAVGVSGSIQHRAGMQSSKTIVAINKDPKAPIFAVSDFSVVGDLHTVIPTLIEQARARKA